MRIQDRIVTARTPDHISQTVTVSGWIHTRRDHGKITFFDLRDRWGLLQIVASSTTTGPIKDLRPESVVTVVGTVVKRPERLINSQIPSGTVELQATSIELISAAKTPPFEIDKDTTHVDEETRLRYRYLDLRSERMVKNLTIRHTLVTAIRQYLNDREFIEVETAMLTKGTPEGAREFIVPSRLHAGKFYVLPQSPQQYKQLLMVAGFDRYYQIARAFRDEDQRGDRQPEHTQLDLEMSFVTQEDVLDFMEGLFTNVVAQHFPTKHLTASPWPRLTYQESMKRYGTDKPDLRTNKADGDELAFGFVTDFPLFAKDPETGKLDAEHHPFCMPHPDDIDKLESHPEQVRAWSYDMVLNGFEIASGSIRIHQPDLQQRIFQLMGLSDAEVQDRFGHMLEAFRYGAPPHGGMAPGIDRIAMILAREPNIREVMAFPKTGDAREPLTGAPTALIDQRLQDVHIQLLPSPTRS
ncbi:aspartate--tRNA ligase [Candidatus Berkelbacteria bacterium]|nr:aspartate--tRNA ligase [Candidatus Berkelbacteria bacterium]